MRQVSLLEAAPTAGPRPLEDVVSRTDLGGGAWLDVGYGWLTGTDALFNELVASVPWRAERRRMYDRTVDVPRLLSFYDEGRALPHPMLEECRDLLNSRYESEGGGPFVTVGLARYRSGGDSVAWHGDTIGRKSSDDTKVAIVSLGSPRRFLLRRREGGPSLRFELGGGDLLVMGGSCQRTWQHSVPKTSREVGPRISVQFRTAGVG